DFGDVRAILRRQPARMGSDLAARRARTAAGSDEEGGRVARAARAGAAALGMAAVVLGEGAAGGGLHPGCAAPGDGLEAGGAGRSVALARIGLRWASSGASARVVGVLSRCRAARRAGSSVAISATVPSTMSAADRAAGSLGPTPKRRLANIRAVARAPPIPMNRPMPTIAALSRATSARV